VPGSLAKMDDGWTLVCVPLCRERSSRCLSSVLRDRLTILVSHLCVEEAVDLLGQGGDDEVRVVPQLQPEGHPPALAHVALPESRTMSSVGQIRHNEPQLPSISGVGQVLHISGDRSPSHASVKDVW
jgi:hypothetical protein